MVLAMVGSKVEKAGRSTASCSECQRRKQKCSRQWPCNHCQSRKIPHLCKYPQKQVSGAKSSVDTSRTSHSDDNIRVDVKPEEPELKATDLPALAVKDELRGLGYLPDDQNLLFGNAAPMASKTTPHQPAETMSSEMRNVLRILPPKPYTDILVERYLEVTNYSYYCLYPPTFSEDYAAWWSDRAKGSTLAPEFTCLLLRVCSCSAQYLDIETQQKLESDLGEPVQSLSESYHNAAKQLSNTIPPGKGGLTQIQQLFLTAAWYKAESFFVESWHALSAAIHEAQELGMHKSSSRAGLSEFDVEMRRRMWCLLYVWDWQMSLLLSRPLIINQLYYPLELPNMQLECHGVKADPPSPVAHITSQCELGKIISRVPATLGSIDDFTQANAIKSDIDQWFASLPPVYRENDPDTRWDEKHVYVSLQRHQLWAVGYMTMLVPFKAFLTKTFDRQNSESDKALRKTAVDIAVHLIDVAHRLFEHVYPINAKFHLVTFLLFDTAAFLCSAMIHDKDRSLPQRETIIQNIGLACSLMQKLAQVTKTGAICYPVLVRLAKSVSTSSRRTAHLAGVSGEVSGLGSSGAGPSPEMKLDEVPPLDAIFAELLPLPMDHVAPNDIFLPTSCGHSVPGRETPPVIGVGDFSNLDVGQFDQIWDWQNLDLTLFPA